MEVISTSVCEDASDLAWLNDAWNEPPTASPLYSACRLAATELWCFMFDEVTRTST